MTRAYAENLVRQILHQQGGNVSAAHIAIQRRALEDPQLLQGLAAPYLKAIISHALNRAERGADIPRVTPPPQSKPLMSDALSSVLDQWSSQQGNPSILAGTTGAPDHRTSASKRHSDTIKALAAAQRKNRLEEY